MRFQWNFPVAFWCGADSSRETLVLYRKRPGGQIPTKSSKCRAAGSLSIQPFEVSLLGAVAVMGFESQRAG
jgi:hypothetical protein